MTIPGSFQFSTAGFSQANPSGPAPGILEYLRQVAGGWPGAAAAAAKGGPALEELEQEKARAGPAMINMPAFLPYFDDHTGETPGMRRQYRKMLVEPVVKACIQDKVLDLASLDFHVNAPDDTGKSSQEVARDKEVAAFNQWNLTSRVEGGLPGLAWNICAPMLIDGYSVCNKVRAVHDDGRYRGKVVLDKLKSKDVDNDIILVTDEYRNIVGLQGMRYNAGEFFSPQDFTIAEYMKMYEKPGGMSDLRAAYAAYWMLDTCRKLRIMGVEKRTFPIIHATYRDLSQKQSTDQALAALRATNFLSSPESMQTKAIDISGQSHQIFKETIEDLKQDIAIALVGAYLQIMGGSQGQQRGDTSEHRSTADLVKWYLMSVFLQVVNRQIIPEFTDLNYVGVDYPEAVMGGIDEADLKAASEVDVNLQKMGLSLSKRAMYKKYGREAPRDPGDELKPPQPQPPGGPGGAMGEGTTITRRFAPPATNGNGNGNGHAAAGVAAEPFCETETDWGYRFGRTDE